MSKELSEMCPLGEKIAKIWLKRQENGEKKSQMAKVMAKEKFILARTLLRRPPERFQAGQRNQQTTDYVFYVDPYNVVYI